MHKLILQFIRSIIVILCVFLTFQTLNITRFITWQISWKPNRMWKRSWWHSFKISSHSQSATVKLHTVLDEANCYRINTESDVLQWSIWTMNCLMYSETKLNNADKAFDLGKLQKLLQVQCKVLHIVVCCYSVTHICLVVCRIEQNLFVLYMWNGSDFR